MHAADHRSIHLLHLSHTVTCVTFTSKRYLLEYVTNWVFSCLRLECVIECLSAHNICQPENDRFCLNVTDPKMS